jgi:hypothetical protein
MKRIYRYQGFDVRVALEPVYKVTGNITIRPPAGFFPVVLICRAGMNRPEVAPLRLAADDAGPFPGETEAFMVAFATAQRLIEDTLLRD